MPSINFIIGIGLVGLAFIGGVLGTWHNIHNAQGPRERAYAIRMSLLCWLLVIAMFAALALTFGALRKYILIGSFILFPILIYRWSTRHQLIRIVDQRDQDEEGKS